MVIQWITGLYANSQSIVLPTSFETFHFIHVEFCGYPGSGFTIASSTDFIMVNHNYTGGTNISALCSILALGM